FFVLDVYNSDGSPLTVDQIYMQLEKIWNSSLQTNKEPIGILTSQHRQHLGQGLQQPHQGRTRNRFAPSQKSIFTVCLDAPMPRVSDGLYSSRVAAQMLHGGGARWNSGNRWFDKTLQLLSVKMAHADWSMNTHPLKARRFVFLIDYVVQYMQQPDMLRSPMVPLKLRFNITPEVKRDIENAKQNMNMMVHDLDVKVLMFSHFGQNVPKQHKLKCNNMCCSTYESASLRMFKYGRTDVIRSTTLDSSKFVLAMEDPAKPNTEKVALLRQAAQTHRQMTKDTINGQAIDRHLLGLRLQGIEDLTSMPEIFMDTSYAVAQHYNLSAGRWRRPSWT
ncbi:hypothetical protein CRUP_037394, partial [Coryphaenoides rupestris]